MLLFVSSQKPFERRHGDQEKEDRQRQQAQCMKWLVGDCAGDNRNGESVERKTPPWILSTYEDNSQEAHHGNRENGKEKYATCFDNMMARQRMSGLKQSNQALIFK